MRGVAGARALAAREMVHPARADGGAAAGGAPDVDDFLVLPEDVDAGLLGGRGYQNASERKLPARGSHWPRILANEHVQRLKWRRGSKCVAARSSSYSLRSRS